VWTPNPILDPRTRRFTIIGSSVENLESKGRATRLNGIHRFDADARMGTGTPAHWRGAGVLKTHAKEEMEKGTRESHEPPGPRMSPLNTAEMRRLALRLQDTDFDGKVR
jgi:hypothetical protein